MVLKQLKVRLKTASRGHKLLKNKQDELMRQFMGIVQENKKLRVSVEKRLTEAFAALAVAGSVMNPEMLEQSLLYSRNKVEIDVKTQNVMSVKIPVFESNLEKNENLFSFPYSFAQTSGELDDAVVALNLAFAEMIQLAQVEKSMQLLASEIEKTRRRVNALEHVMIPDLEKNIKYISMKLDESDSSTKVRLLKVKEMVLEQAHDFH